ncbi:MAG: ABC transporter substrate-binding protein, partial [Beijerinckiaceae bacterium]|nr:ABC transporter substrate-binding protein [Beijerinckiaceae bacterium]
KGAPQQELAFAYVNELLGAELQNRLAGPTFSIGTNKAVPKPAGLGADVKIHQIDWANVAAQRGDWIKRWDREMAI